jgi:hypothetical protein
MPDSFWLTDLNSFLLPVIKIFFIILSFLYLIFSIIVVHQVVTISKSVKDKFNQYLTIFSLIHLIFAVVLILALFRL